MKTPRICLLALSVSALATGNSQAANIFFDDNNADDHIRITANDFEGGFTVNGNPTADGVAFDTGPEGAPVNFQGMWITNGAITPGTRTIYLVENNDPNVISDILSYTYDFFPGLGGNGAIITGTFQSDANDNLGTISGLPVAPLGTDIFREDGSQITFSQLNITGEVISDVDPVPEPSTWAACGFVALLASGTLYRRLRR